jgi:YegS/Rv2252/BmrU family lipid kinase
MRRARLFYNPQSGQRRGDPRAIVERVAVVLRAAGVDVSIAETLSPGQAGQQAQEAVAQGCDTIFACGGDGTIQDLAQGLVGSDAALAVIPLGTANVLAHDLGIPRDALQAARVALGAVPLRVGVGRMDCQSSDGILVSRYFLSVAGAGQDGYLFHQVAPEDKRTYGIVVYFWKALWVWLTHRMGWFSVDVSATEAKQRHLVTQVLAVRLHDFGNLLRDLAPGASLLREDLRVVLFRTSSRWSYLLYVVRGILGAEWTIPGIELGDASRIRLTPTGVDPVYLEADGEMLGQLPAEITLLPNALTLLAPRDFAARARAQAAARQAGSPVPPNPRRGGS